MTSKLPAATRESLDAEGQAIWDRIAAVRPNMRGPYTVLLRSPDMAGRVAALDDYFRSSTSMSALDMEIVVLVTARESGARFVWARHEAAARSAGAGTTLIEAIRTGSATGALSPREGLLVDLARSLVRSRAIPDEVFDRARDELGDVLLVEATVLAGHYATISTVANAFGFEPAEFSGGF